MKWFDTTFLPSLFEKAGVGKSLWLSRKQTDVCVKYMEQHVVCFQDEMGNICHRLNYTCIWQDRDVFLSYSKLNGCGTISFGFNTAEKIENEKTAEKARQDKKHEQLSRHFQRRREKFDTEYKVLVESLKEIEEYIAEDKQTGDEVMLKDDLIAQSRKKQEIAIYEQVIRENS